MVDTNIEPDLEKCSSSIIYSTRRKNINAERPPSREKRKKIDEERPHAFACENRENIGGERPSASWRNVRLKAYGHAKVDRPTTHWLPSYLLDNNSQMVSIKQGNAVSFASEVKTALMLFKCHAVDQKLKKKNPRHLPPWLSRKKWTQPKMLLKVTQ